MRLISILKAISYTCSSTDRGGGTDGQTEPEADEVCPWDTSDNVCPWESASTSQPPRQQSSQQSIQTQQSTTTTRSQQPPQPSLPQKQQQLTKPRPDRSKSMDVNPMGETQKPQSTTFTPSLGPIRGVTPTDTSYATTESKVVGRKATRSLTSPKELVVATVSLTPTGGTGGEHYVGTERRASEGVLRLTLSASQLEQVTSESQRMKQKQEAIEPAKKPKEKASIKVKVLPTTVEKKTPAPEEQTAQHSKKVPSKPSSSTQTVSKSLEGKTSTQAQSSLSPTSKTVSEAKGVPKTKKVEQSAVLSPSGIQQEEATSATPIEAKLKGAESVSQQATGKALSVVAPWEESPPQKPTDVCPWEDE